MNSARFHKSNHKNASDNKHRRQEHTAEMLIRALDILADHAGSAQLGTASRILFNAKEELVHWAVTMNFYESAQDRFINQHLYDQRHAAVESLVMRALKKSGDCDEMLSLLGLPKAKQAVLAARK